MDGALHRARRQRLRRLGGEHPARALRGLPAGLPLRGRRGNRIVRQYRFIAKTNDSLEYPQTYTENSQTVKALTTSCIGQLASNETAPSTPVAHLVSCTQYDPFAAGKFVRGLGETITYPDGQFQETCNVPDYSNSVVCTAGTRCSTDVSADDTSNLDVLDSADTGGTLTETVDYGTPLSCAGRTELGSYTGFDPNWYGFSYTGSGNKTITYDLFNLPSARQPRRGLLRRDRAVRDSLGRRIGAWHAPRRHARVHRAAPILQRRRSAHPQPCIESIGRDLHEPAVSVYIDHRRHSGGPLRASRPTRIALGHAYGPQAVKPGSRQLHDLQALEDPIALGEQLPIGVRERVEDVDRRRDLVLCALLTRDAK